MEQRFPFFQAAALAALTAATFTGPVFAQTCESNPCLHGSCFDGGEGGGFYCSCDPGWTGELCDAEEVLEAPPVVTPTSVCWNQDFATTAAPLIFDYVGDANQGGIAVTGGRLQLTSDGTSFYHGQDNGGFAHRWVLGDFRVEVQLEGFPVNAGGGYRRSGLTVRTGTGEEDARVFVEFLPQHPVYNQPALMFDYRTASGTAAELASTKLGTIPTHLAIDRRGDKFTVWYSTDGLNWVKPAGAAGGSITLPISPFLEVGMMSASYDATTTLTSEFDDFELCQPNSEMLPSLPEPAACEPGRPLDVVYLLDTSGSAGHAFPNGPTQVDAAQAVIARLNARLAAELPGSRASLVVYRGGPAPLYATGTGGSEVQPLSASFSAIDASVAAINPAAINPSTSSPLAIGLERVRGLLHDQGDPANQPILVLLGDGGANVDANGFGPQYYKSAELAALSVGGGGVYYTVGEMGWRGNWNGPIATWDGKALADAMQAGIVLKADFPELRIETVGLHGDASYRGDLFGFLAEYGGGQLNELTDAAEAEALADAIFGRLDCTP